MHLRGEGSPENSFIEFVLSFTLIFDLDPCFVGVVFTKHMHDKNGGDRRRF